MTEESLRYINDIHRLMDDIKALITRFSSLEISRGTGVIEIPYSLNKFDELREGLSNTVVSYLKEQLEKYEKEFEEL